MRTTGECRNYAHDSPRDSSLCRLRVGCPRDVSFGNKTINPQPSLDVAIHLVVLHRAWMGVLHLPTTLVSICDDQTWFECTSGDAHNVVLDVSPYFLPYGDISIHGFAYASVNNSLLTPRRAPLDAPHGPSETTPVLWNP